LKKIILSRKGYDDQYGGKPSVILPDGTMLSFPIPVFNPKEEGKRTEELFFRGQPLPDILKQLDPKHENKVHHVDPDLYGLAGTQCLGAFGQSGAALGHLNNQKVDTGDVFLFFGTFCQSKNTAEGLEYEKMHPFHAIFGYLIVDKRLTMDDIDSNPEFGGLRLHPHYINREADEYKRANAIFYGKDFGYFRFAENLRLTKPGYKKTWWQLPMAFSDAKISYHENAEKLIFGDCVELQSVAKGQEFVLESSPALEEWLSAILKNKIEK
jgi:hypothetical protein